MPRRLRHVLGGGFRRQLGVGPAPEIAEESELTAGLRVVLRLAGAPDPDAPAPGTARGVELVELDEAALLRKRINTLTKRSAQERRDSESAIRELKK